MAKNDNTLLYIGGALVIGYFLMKKSTPTTSVNTSAQTLHTVTPVQTNTNLVATAATALPSIVTTLKNLITGGGQSNATQDNTLPDPVYIDTVQEATPAPTDNLLNFQLMDA